MKPTPRKKPRASTRAKKTPRPEGEPLTSPNHQLPSNDGKPALPKGWVWTRLGEIRLDKSEGVLPSKTPDQKFELYSVPNFEQDKPEIKLGKEIGSNKQTVEEGAVLVCKINPRINRIWIVGNHTAYPKIASTEWIPFFKQDGIDPKYLCYFMRTNNFRDYLASNVSGVGGSLMRVKASVIERYGFPLPPLPEQHRIVAKIEELFTKLDAGVAELKKAKAQLQRYRQSVLKDAFSGKLTQAWREAHQHELEPAAALLERIKAERKKNAKGKYKEPPPVDTSNLPELPEGWVWTTIEEIAESMKNGIYRPKDSYNDDGIACLRMYNIENGRIVWKNIKRMRLTKEEVQEYELRPGDILVNRVNSRELVGKAATIPYGLELCVYESKNIRLRLLIDYIQSKYISFWFRIFSQQYFNRNAQQTVGMASINQEQLGAMPAPFPSIDEQNQIVSEIERRFSIAEEVEKVIDHSLKQAERLRQSILQRAFAGKLVAQDPNDEPAEKLLERIVRSSRLQAHRA
jgi:type I restriction enzyme S subunit